MFNVWSRKGYKRLSGFIGKLLGNDRENTIGTCYSNKVISWKAETFLGLISPNAYVVSLGQFTERFSALLFKLTQSRWKLHDRETVNPHSKHLTPTLSDVQTVIDFLGNPFYWSAAYFSDRLYCIILAYWNNKISHPTLITGTVLY